MRSNESRRLKGDFAIRAIADNVKPLINALGVYFFKGSLPGSFIGGGRLVEGGVYIFDLLAAVPSHTKSSFMTVLCSEMSTHTLYHYNSWYL